MQRQRQGEMGLQESRHGRDDERKSVCRTVFMTMDSHHLADSTWPLTVDCRGY